MTEALVVAAVAVGALLLALLVAPLESLGWWAGWFGRRDELEQDIAAAQAGRVPPDDDGRPDDPFAVVFLPGVGSTSGREHSRSVLTFLARLRERLPGAVIVQDVFPYSPDGVGLTGERFFSWVWRLLRRVRRVPGGKAATLVVNLRNIFQVLVSADGRYGPIFNYGTSRHVVLGLLRAGYRPGSGRPVFILGTSGGGQISLGVAPYVQDTMRAPVEVVSLGGVMSSDPALRHIAHVTHLYGTDDRVQAVGAWAFPSRWRTSVMSTWNRAVREGRIERIPIGHLRHQGRGGYLDSRTVLDDGRTPLDVTLDAVTAVIERHLAHHAEPRA